MIVFYALLSIAFSAIDLTVSYLIGWPLVNWWAPLFARQTPYMNGGVALQGYKLPFLLAWFDTFDADLDAGTRNGSITGTSTYWNRVKWLNRNSAYGLSYWALGVPFVAADWRVIKYEQTTDRLTFIAVEPGGHFNIHVTRLGLEIKLGWKAWNYYDTATGKWKDQPWGPAWRAPFVISITLA